MVHFNVQHDGGLCREKFIATAIGAGIYAESVYDVITEACEVLGLSADYDEEELPNNADPNIDAITITFSLTPMGEGEIKMRSEYRSNIGLDRIYRSVWKWVASQIAQQATEIANQN